MTLKEFQQKVKELPEPLQVEVLNFVDQLVVKYQSHRKKTTKPRFNFSWEGDLKELKSDYTSVELQHRANEYR